MKKRDLCGGALLFVYLLAVGFLTGPSIFQLLIGRLPGVRLELIPFVDVLKVLSDVNTPGLGVFANIAGNVLMFVPLGVLLPLFWPWFSSLRRTVLWGFGMSVSIELIQMISGGVTSVDDVLLNTLGALVGYLCAVGLLRLFPRLRPVAAGRAEWRWPLLLWIVVIIVFTAVDFSFLIG